MALVTTGAFGGLRVKPPHNGPVVLPASHLIEWSSWPYEGTGRVR
jgi:hypothetical protein